MKQAFQKIALLFTTVIVLSGTQYGQSTTHNDTTGIIYTDAQDKRCLECLVNSPKKDSVIKLLKLNANDYIMTIDNVEKQKAVLADLSAQLKSDNTMLQKKIARQKKAKRINLMIGFAGGLGSALLINSIFP